MSAAAAFAVLAGALSVHGFIGDIGWDVANGLWILHHGLVPLHNFLTSGMYGARWDNAEWLWGLYTALGFALFGLGGVFAFELPVLAALAWLIARAARPLGAYWQALASIGAAAALAPAINPRPQIASFAFFLLALQLLSLYRETGRTWPLWLAAATGAVWINVHGSVVLLPLLLVLEFLFAPSVGRPRIAGPALLSVALLGLHPGGFVGVFQNLHHVSSSGNTAVIVEWLSPNFHAPVLWPGGAALLIGLILLAPALYRARRPADLVLLLGSAVAMLWAVRFLPYLVLVVLARGIEMLPSGMRPQYGGPGGAGRSLQLRSNAVGATVALGLLAFVGTRPIFPPRFPTGAVAYLRRHHIQRVFNWYSVGASLEPYGIRPYIDGRDNIWVQSQWWPRYVDVTTGQYSVLRFLARYDPRDRYVLWFARSPVALVLDASPHWRRVYVDPNPRNTFASIQGPYVIWQRTP